MFYAGTAFWVLTEAPKHLWFIISEPQIDDSRILYVNFTSYHADRPAEAENDPACIVNPGEHPFVQHQTCVYYYGAQVGSLTTLENRYKAGRIRLDQPASSELLQKMRDCAGKSMYMETQHYQILEDQHLV